MTGLRRTAIARKTELKRGAPLRRKTAMKKVAMAQRTVAKQRKARDTGPNAKTKALLWARAAGKCELCGVDLTFRPFSRHHRRSRGSGGSTVPWINNLSNLLLLCGSATTPGGCHERVERNRGDEAYIAGWRVHKNGQYLPAEVPALIRRVNTIGFITKELLYLSDDGDYIEGSP